ncbi:MAG: hypothetical protein IKE05_05510 [Clostridia bacterium]|nr:hypothetical protein [Clostridia bacterium]
MTYYIFIEDNKTNGAGQCEISSPDVEIINFEVSEELYNSFNADPDRYMWNGAEVVENPDYEEIKQQKERLRLDALTLTPADVERVLYKAKEMDFEDLKSLIAQRIPNIDLKGLAIEFRAKDFYRGAMANNMRLFDVVGALLGYTPQDMDYLFEHKELPNEHI